MNQNKIIGIFGSGRVATNLAEKLVSVGYKVNIGIQSEADKEVWKGPSVTFLNHRSVAVSADIIINATPGETSLERLTELRTELSGRILIDLSNATTRASDGLPGELIYSTSSLGERIQKALPETKVVKTLNTMLFLVMTNPSILNTSPRVFLSGDDEGAKSAVKTLLREFGWPSESMEDLGGIQTAQATEAAFQLASPVLRRSGFKPFAISIAR